ncbi:MAG: hypothetical protein V1873_01200 [Verrucomicrobiota bacterium]
MTGFQKDLVGAAIFSAAFVLVLVAAELWRRSGKARPEWSRKLVHLVGGLLSLVLPLLVASPWVVLALCATMFAVLLVGRRTGSLQSLHGVARPTRGVEYYPLAVFLVFFLSEGRYWLYVSSLLVLAVADAFAALVGSRYGSIRYQVETEYKTLEGSVFFLISAFLAMHLPMLLLTDLPRATCVLAALLVAAIVTGFEAISLHGADNLFVPIGVCVILSKITSKPVSEIVYQIVSLALISTGVGVVVHRVRSFNVGGTILFLLFVYGAWSLGSELWALPVLAAFAAYMVAWFAWPVDSAKDLAVRVRLMFHAIVVPTLILVVGNTVQAGSTMYAPFLVAMATVLSFILLNHRLMAGLGGGVSRAGFAAKTALVSSAVVLVPPWCILANIHAGILLVYAAVVLAAALVNHLLIGREPRLGSEQRWSAARILLTLVAAGAVLLMELAGVLPLWNVIETVGLRPF